jgi:hypothetical protein
MLVSSCIVALKRSDTRVIPKGAGQDPICNTRISLFIVLANNATLAANSKTVPVTPSIFCSRLER